MLKLRLILNNKYNELYKLLDYLDCTIIILDDIIKSDLVISLPEHFKIFDIKIESIIIDNILLSVILKF